MQVVEHVGDWRAVRAGPDFAGRGVGFVPTMGALHAGHRSLLERARRENEVVVLSIFVNPTQFNDPSDLQKYPRTWTADLEIARGAGADWVFAPRPEELYPDGYRFRVSEHQLSRTLEGASRPGHFDGVLTVVLKLLQLVRADRAYFGEKDLQQWMLVRDLVEAFFVPTAIVRCPIVRAPDGLALSSRNTLLSPAGRGRAPEFPRILRGERDPAAARAKLAAAGFAVDYVEDLEQWRVGAVRIDGIRLIDNVRREDPV